MFEKLDQTNCLELVYGCTSTKLQVSVTEALSVLASFKTDDHTQKLSIVVTKTIGCLCGC